MGRRFFMMGVVLMLLGGQLRFVDSFVLTSKASQFVESRLHNTGLQSDNPYDAPLMSFGPLSTFSKKTFTPPPWLGWAMLSVGGVLVLHGLTISRLD